ncbi:uncharacterized protein LOC119988171 [Tripterygium wilfordii]|uniref:uncharacterized protein LOC119988171 n=1 Tax=Tripterygium wilfordii TaxID=458696 RepID=UPI0018F808F9|nr:uncharacterized protein LOC119988171 [Tripterygium wilfordii]
MAEGPPGHGNRAQEVNPEDLEASMPVRDPSNVVSQPPPPLQEQPKSAVELNKTPQEQAIDETKEPEKEDKVEEEDFIPYSDDDYYYPDEDEEEEEEEEDEDQPQQEEGKGGGGVEGGNSSDEKGKQLYSTDSFTFNPTAFEMIKRPYKDIEESSNPPESAKKMKEECSASDEKDPFLEGLMIDVNGEIAFLNNLIEYHSRNMVYPFEDFLALDDYIKEWLKVDVPKDKLMEKITWLKRKYMEEAGKITAFRPREEEAIELCKKIWGTSDERAAGGDSPIINLTSLIKNQSEGNFDFDEGGTVKVKRMKEMGATSGDKDPVMKFLERLAGGDDVNADVSFLNELIEYHSNNLIYPFEHFIALDDFIKDWLKVDVPKDKMREIIDGLKRKYGKEVGEMGKITDLGPQQRKAIELVKKIWPDEIGTQTKEDEDIKESPKDGSEHDSS